MSLTDEEKEKRWGHLRQYHFKKGESPNPGGKSTVQAALERKNAMAALRVKEAMVAAVEEQIEQAKTADEVAALIKPTNLSLLDGVEDRGLGKAIQSVKVDAGVEHGTPGTVTRRIVDPAGAGPGDTDSEVGSEAPPTED